MATWELVREEWNKAEQMGYQSVLQAAKVGGMLIELKEETPHGAFEAKVTSVLLLNKMATSRLMTLARNLALLEKHQPDSQRKALEIIRSNTPRKEPSVRKNQDQYPGYLGAFEEAGLISATTGKEGRDKAKASFRESFGSDYPTGQKRDHETDRRIDVAMAFVASGSQKKKAAAEAAEKAASEIPKSAKEKLERAVKVSVDAELARLRGEFAEAVEQRVAELRAELAKELSAASEWEQRAKAEYEAANQIRLGIDSHMTQEEFQLVRNCLHPDRAPDDRKDRFEKAFQIFNRLEKTVNTKAPISTLRDRGWEKVSPKFRG